MTFVVTESCIMCKDPHCVDVCSTDAFREGPVEAIFAEDDVPPGATERWENEGGATPTGHTSGASHSE